jgi:serine protease
MTAPGGDINVDQNGDGYGDGILQETHDGVNYTVFGYYFYQGTSMAAPHVSGVAALLVASGAATTPDQVREVLQFTAKDKGSSGWDPDYGWGIVDAYAALTHASASNTPPVADAGPDQTVLIGAAVTLDGSGFFDEEGGTLTYEWDFGDDSTGSGVTVTHTYPTAGVYTATLTVTDSEGLTGTDTAKITVTEAADSVMHVFDIAMSTQSRKAGKNIFTMAVAAITVVDSSGSTVQGATVNASWSGATSDVDSGITDAAGKVTLYSDEIKGAGTFTCTISNVAKTGWTYDASDQTTASITTP